MVFASTDNKLMRVGIALSASECFPKYQEKIETNWTVLSGAPSSGKSTIIDALAKLGFATSHEIARDVLVRSDMRGVGADELLNLHPLISQHTFSAETYQQELSLDPAKQIILDRSLTDSLAFLRAYGLDIPPNIAEAADRFSYKQVIILKRLTLDKDGFRPKADEFYDRVEVELFKIYTERKIPVKVVPVMPVGKRLSRIIELLAETK